MSENSLFAVLLRSSWWVSFAIAIVLAVGARLTLPADYATYAPFTAFPFIITGVMAAWKQWKRPSVARVTATLEAIGAMSWREFSGLLEQAFQRSGHEVSRGNGAADLTLVKSGRTTLVACKRWKAASHGVEALRELEAARRAQDAHEAIYVAAGSITDNARRFAVDHGVALMQGPELAGLLRLPKSAAKAGA